MKEYRSVDNIILLSKNFLYQCLHVINRDAVVLVHICRLTVILRRVTLVLGLKDVHDTYIELSFFDPLTSL